MGVEIYLIGNEAGRDSALAVADGFLPVDFSGDMLGVVLGIRERHEDLKKMKYTIVGGREVSVALDGYFLRHGLPGLEGYGTGGHMLSSYRHIRGSEIRFPDVVFAEIDLPDMGGVEFAEKLRELEKAVVA